MKTASGEPTNDDFGPTRLSVFLQFFGLLTGLVGLALHNQNLVIVGGLCCCFIDFVRIGRTLWRDRELIARSMTYVFVVPVLSLSHPFLVAFAGAGLLNAALIIAFAFLPRMKRRRPLFIAKDSSR